MKRLAVFIGCIGITLVAFGQNDLDRLKAPSSPAASVLGIQPTTLLNPKSYEALETSLFSNYFNSNGGALFPNDLGIEFTPYWASDRKLTVEEYLFPKPIESLVRNISFSLATTQNYVLSDSVNSNALGVGFRTTLYFTDNKLKEQTLQDLDLLIDAKRIKSILINSIATFLLLHPDSVESTPEFVDWYVQELKAKDDHLKLFKNKYILEKTTIELAVKLKAELPEYSSDPDGYFFQEANRILDEFWAVAAKREKIESFVIERPGLKLEMAGALSVDFPTNDFGFSIAPQKSLWLTPAYTFKGNTLFVKLLGVLRYNAYDLNFYEKFFPNEEYFEHNIDYGGAVNLSSKKFTFQFECVGRSSKTIIEKNVDVNSVTTTRTVQQSDFQYVGSFSYQINDNMMITYNLGDQFEPILNYKGTLISLLSVNFGFGGPTSDTISE